MTAYFYVFVTVALTVYTQLIFKWQAVSIGVLPDSWWAKILVLLQLFLNPWILSGLLAAFLAAMSWMAAMTELPLSHVYPFVAIIIVLVVLGGGIFFNEPLTWPKILGSLIAVIGVVISSQG